jgi:sortase A
LSNAAGKKWLCADTAEARFARRRHIVACVLIFAGGVLAFGAQSLIQLNDSRLAWTRSRETAAWEHRENTQASRPPVPGPARPSTIKPGREGYLLIIPKIKLRAIVRELEPEVFSGRNTPALKRYGLGQLPYTQQLRNVSPGADGTAAITGHRTTSGAPFRQIDRLRPGDLIIIRKMRGEQQWVVVDFAVVPPSALYAVQSRSGIKKLVLLACTPPFTARERLVVNARLKQDTATSPIAPTRVTRL